MARRTGLAAAYLLLVRRLRRAMWKRRSILFAVAGVAIALIGYAALVFARPFPIYDATRADGRYVLRNIPREKHVLDEISWRVFKASGLWITRVAFTEDGTAYAFTPTSAVYELEGMEFPYWALIDRHHYSGPLEHFSFPRSTKKRPSDLLP